MSIKHKNSFTLEKVLGTPFNITFSIYKLSQSNIQKVPKRLMLKLYKIFSRKCEITCHIKIKNFEFLHINSKLHIYIFSQRLFKFLFKLDYLIKHLLHCRTFKKHTHANTLIIY